jgi:dienelactone hydrolase
LTLEHDHIFTTSLRHESEEILANNQGAWQLNLFGGVEHGFALRADLTDTHQKWAKEQAFYQAVSWFGKYL